MRQLIPVCFRNLSEMLQSPEYQCFESSKLGNDLFIHDPSRAARIWDAAEYGTDGSTHAERMEDWREYLDSLRVVDPEFPEDGGEIEQGTVDSITMEIDACEAWHEKNGSLDQAGV